MSLISGSIKMSRVGFISDMIITRTHKDRILRETQANLFIVKYTNEEILYSKSTLLVQHIP